MGGHRPRRLHSWPMAMVVVLLITVVGVGVGPGAPSSSNVIVAGSAFQRDLEPTVEESDVSSIVQSNNWFAFDLYHQVNDLEGNIILSPFSLIQALMMTMAGARGTTESQIASALRLELEQARAHPAMNALDLALEEESGDPKEFKLENVNALWGQHDLSFEPGYLDTLALNYGAVMNLLDFESAPDAARLEINQWASDQTQGRITDLISPGQVSPDTRLVLANAIYFRAIWQHPFDPWATRAETFNARNGTEVDVPMMRQTHSFRFMSERDYRAIELPYAGRDFAMLIILPDQGDFDAIEEKLTAEFVASMIGELRREEVEVTIPKFEYESRLDFEEGLKRLGMVDAFADSADFAGFTGAADLKLDMVVQKAFVSVDEEATEAAASSAAGIVLVRAKPRFVADRPFIYLIRDRSTGAVLFIGRVEDPSR